MTDYKQSSGISAKTLVASFSGGILSTTVSRSWHFLLQRAGSRHSSHSSGYLSPKPMPFQPLLLLHFHITFAAHTMLTCCGTSINITTGKMTANEEEQQNQTQIKPSTFIKISLKQYNKKQAPLIVMKVNI